MNDTRQRHRIDPSQAEQVLADHRASLATPGNANYRFQRAALRRFLSDLSQSTETSASKALIVTEKRLLDWLIREARRRTTASAGCCCTVVSR